MNTLSVGLVISSAVIHALRNFLTKISDDKQVFIWCYEICAVTIYLPLFLYFLSTYGIQNPVAVYFGVAAGLAHAVYWIFLSRAYEEGDISHVYPIMRSDPALVLIFSLLFLKEQVSLPGLTGIILVVIGVYVINMKELTAKELLVPFQSAAKNRAVQFAVLTLFSVALYSIIDKMGVSYVHPLIFAYLFTVCALVFFTPYIFLTKGRALIRSEWKRNRKPIIVNGFMGIFGYSLILIAFTLEKVSYIVGLRQLSIVFTVLLGGHILREKHRAIRYSAAAIIFVGAFLISIAK
jgi:uncharacterized membrane protein